MLFASSILPGSLQLALLVIMLPSVIVAIRYAKWHLLLASRTRQHLFFGGMLAALLLWQLRIQVVDGVWIHLLGMTALTLVLGWCYAVIAGTLVALAYTLMAGESLLVVPGCWLFSVLIPASVTRLLLLVIRRTNIQNLFLFLLGAGFGGAALSVLLIAVVALPVLWLGGQGMWAREALTHAPFILLVMFPEAFINGLIVSALTVFYPDLVKTFDEDFYLDGRG
ncbi:MAG: energy-coupling factor ABC transporter permease [Pseudomonadota bacterium]